MAGEAGSVKIALRIQPVLLDQLRELYPEMMASEAIRFCVAYTLDKRPEVRLPQELTLKGTVIK